MIDVKSAVLLYCIYGVGDKMENTRLADNLELYTQYDWFSREYPNAIQNACDEFFLPGFQFILLGISKNVNNLMDKDAYFVTKIMIDKLHDMFFRLSEKTVAMILDKILGRAESKFNLNKLTDLEAKIITGFNDYVYNSISQFLVPAPPTIKRENFDVIHLTFLMKDIDKNVSSKFIITLPQVLLKPDIINSSEEKFDYGDFASSVVEAKVKVGTTKVKLIDVKNMDVDDIVVFDNSDTKHMVLKYGDFEADVNLNPNLGLVLPFDNDEGESDMAENTNLWDSIEVEMSAQFDAVKVTLGELKNIENGLVVDLTSIYDNKVTLSVEDKPIARGELVIVNDRYGVKIDEVIVNGGKSEEVNTEDEYQEYPQDENSEIIEEEPQETTSEETSEEDEFDYSDFELEDEDI